MARFGWKGREAEWIALVSLHGGVFTRSQFRFYLSMGDLRALRFVRALINRGVAAEDPALGIGGLGRVCRIFSRRIYRALGAEDIRHRRIAAPEVLLRRLLSLDYVLEHTKLSWLPTEPEKVGCFKRLGFPRKRLPLRAIEGPWRPTEPFSSMSIPGTRPVRPCGLGEWRIEAFGKLCARGAEKVLHNWADGASPEAHTGDPSAAREYAKIKRAVLTGRTTILDSYGDVTAALKRAIELEPLADRSFRVVIDGYSTWQSTRLWRGPF